MAKEREEKEREKLSPEAFARKLEEVRRWLDGKRERERPRAMRDRPRWEAEMGGGGAAGAGAWSGISRTGTGTRSGTEREGRNVYGVRRAAQNSSDAGARDHVSRENGHGQARHPEASRVAASAVLGRRRVRVAGDL